MSDAPPDDRGLIDYDALPPRCPHAFAWTFGTAVTLPLIAGVVTRPNDLWDPAGALEVAGYVLALSAVVWALAFAFGVAMRLSFDVDVGKRIMMGALCGATVGFALCFVPFVIGRAL